MQIEAITQGFLEKVGLGDVIELPFGVRFDANILIKGFEEIVAELGYHEKKEVY